jgi:hypothetical protein
MRRLPGLSVAAAAQAYPHIELQLARFFQSLDTPTVDSHLMLTVTNLV